MELFKIEEGHYAGETIRTAPNKNGVLCAHAHDFMRVAKQLKSVASGNDSWVRFKKQYPSVLETSYNCQFSRQKCDGLDAHGMELEKLNN